MNCPTCGRPHSSCDCTARAEFEHALEQCGFGRDIPTERRERVQFGAVAWSIIWTGFLVVFVWSRRSREDAVMAARGIDLTRLYEAEAAKERNEVAEKRRLSQARVNLKRRMDEIELGNEDTYDFSN